MNHRKLPWALTALAMSIACAGAAPSTSSNATPSGASASPSSTSAPTAQGSSPGAPSSPTPTASGLGFAPQSAIHGIGPAGTTLVFSDTPDLCAALSQQNGAGTSALGAEYLEVAIASTPPGTFSGTAKLVSAGRVVVSTGGATLQLSAESSDGALTGSYDLGADGISGQFTSSHCPALDAEAGAGAGPSEASSVAASAPSSSSSSPSSPSSSSSSCSMSINDVNGVAIFDERCTSNERQCTLGAGASSWTCTCTAASGSQSTCQAPVAKPGVVTIPANCCSGG